MRLNAHRSGFTRPQTFAFARASEFLVGFLQRGHVTDEVEGLLLPLVIHSIDESGES